MARLNLLARQLLPTLVYQLMSRHFRRLQDQPNGTTPDFGDLRRLDPISREFGYDRGLPIDRYYIENFLARQTRDIRGHVLEIGDDSYTRRFGGKRVIASDVLHITSDNPAATIIGDLTRADHIPSDTFDCVILTQTLHFIYNVQAALKTVQRILKPGGVVLATFPGISQIAGDTWGDYQCWAFTTLSTQRLFEEVFPKNEVSIEGYGNVMTAMAFLHGLAAEELTSEELEYRDGNYELLITVRAQKQR